MKMKGKLRRSLSWAAIGVIVATSIFLAARPRTGALSPSERAVRIAQDLRCPDCESTSVAESRTSSAGAIRDDILVRVQAGETDAEIRQAYVDRYGEWILLVPDGDGIGGLIWAIPIFLIVLGAGGLAFGIAWSKKRFANLGSVGEVNEVNSTGLSKRIIVIRVAAIGSLLAFSAGAAIAVKASVGDRAPGQTASGNAQADPADALADLAELLSANPSDAELHLDYAQLLLSSGNASEALRHFDDAARLDESLAEAHAYGGWVLYLASASPDAQGRIDPAGAVTRLDAAIAADPEFADSYFFRGTIRLRALNDPSAAVQDLEKFLALAPDNPLATGVQTLLDEARAQVESEGGLKN